MNQMNELMNISEERALSVLNQLTLLALMDLKTFLAPAFDRSDARLKKTTTDFFPAKKLRQLIEHNINERYLVLQCAIYERMDFFNPSTAPNSCVNVLLNFDLTLKPFHNDHTPTERLHAATLWTRLRYYHIPLTSIRYLLHTHASVLIENDHLTGELPTISALNMPLFQQSITEQQQRILNKLKQISTSYQNCEAKYKPRLLALLNMLVKPIPNHCVFFPLSPSPNTINIATPSPCDAALSSPSPQGARV